MPLPETQREENPERYKRLSEPFESPEAVNEAYAGFFRELGELREKYKIPDVLAVVEANVVAPNGSVMKAVTTFQWGDMSRRGTLVLYLYRQESEVIQKLMEGLAP